MQRTLAIIKPEAVKQQKIGGILAKIEASQMKIVAIKMLKLSIEQAKIFYNVHETKPFFNDLTTYMSSGEVVACALEGDDIVRRYRDLIGDTDPQKAQSNTLRKMFGTSKFENAVHGSDSLENAQKEILFFFKDVL